MIDKDTVRLLRECDAGVQMGVASLDGVLNYISSHDLKQLLRQCKKEHEELGREIEALLDKYKDDGKNPNPIAKGMSWMKTNVKLVLDESDATVADLITDGCNMGVKSLSRYLNEYKAADEVSKDIAKRLIHLEAELAAELRTYL